MHTHAGDETSEPASALAPTTSQQVFLRYFTAILIDLTVLGLFSEYWDAVVVSSFTVALVAALLLQLMLKATIALEHRIAGRFEGKSGTAAKIGRFGAAWAILFGSKFAMLWILGMVFGDRLVFHGAYHGVVAFIVLVVVMLLAEEAVVRFYRKLG